MIIAGCFLQVQKDLSKILSKSILFKPNRSRRLCFAISRERNHSAASRKIQPIIGTEASSAQSTALLSCSPRESLWKPSSAELKGRRALWLAVPILDSSSLIVFQNSALVLLECIFSLFTSVKTTYDAAAEAASPTIPSPLTTRVRLMVPTPAPAAHQATTKPAHNR